MKIKIIKVPKQLSNGASGGYLDAQTAFNEANDTSFAFGGDLQTNSSDFSTGLVHVDEGGTHSENPNGGVQMGKDSQGVPNLVEEGEVIFDDYVFSDRLLLDNEAKEKFHINKKKDVSYAALAKRLEKETSERPNDPISSAGFTAQMQTLQEEQERQKQEKAAQEAKEAFEALPPEEQVAIVNRVAQEQQMAQQAMQEQALAQQQEMVPPVNPEDTVAMPEETVTPEQIPQKQVPVEVPQEMAYGGNIYDMGGALNWLKTHRKDLPASQLPTIAKLMVDVGATQDKPENPDHYYSTWFNKLIPTIDYSKANISKYFKHLVDGGIDKETAYSLVNPSQRGENPELKKELFEYNPVANKQNEVTGDNTSNSNTTSTTVYKALDGNRYNTKAEAMNANKAYLRGQQATQKAGEQNFTMLESQLEEPEKVKTEEPTKAKASTTQAVSPSTSKVSTPKAPVTTTNPTTSVTPTTTGGYPYNGIVYPTAQEATAAINADATRLTHNIFNDTVGTQPDATNPEVPNLATSTLTGNSIIDELNNGQGEPIRTIVKGGTPTMPIDDSLSESDKASLYDFALSAEGKATLDAIRKRQTNNSREDTPAFKDHWMRYAGLIGPATALTMMGAGVGKPDYSYLDSALRSLDGAATAKYRPIGNYLTYHPMDIWFEQNRLNANARATDRAIMNSSAPTGTKIAGLVANAYNNQLASGDLYRKALEYNDAQKARTEEFNRGTDQFNAQAFNQNSQYNASAYNAHKQARAKYGLSAAAQRLDSEAGWYNSLYRNLNNMFKGMADLGTDLTYEDWINQLYSKKSRG